MTSNAHNALYQTNWRTSPRSEESISLLRYKAIASYSEWGIEQFTCDECGHRYLCPSAFDMYNTDGDCLEDK